MPSLGEAPSGGAKTFWLLLGRLPKVTRCKSGTISGRYRSNGYVHGQTINTSRVTPSNHIHPHMNRIMPPKLQITINQPLMLIIINPGNPQPRTPHRHPQRRSRLNLQ